MITVGAASRVINGEIGAHIQAATHQQRVRSGRDDLEANGLFLSNADTRILLVSCDLAGSETGSVAQARQAMAEATGLPPRTIYSPGLYAHPQRAVADSRPPWQASGYAVLGPAPGLAGGVSSISGAYGAARSCRLGARARADRLQSPLLLGRR